jgi:hypothetical protein
LILNKKETIAIMLKRTNTACILAATLAFTITLTGCSEEKSVSKERMEQAFVKQSEMKAYSFTGSADLNIKLPSQGQSKNPLTSVVTGLFTQGKLEWSGAASYEPVRLEADLKSTPKDSTSALELPVILKDNKLFLHIPILNKEGEFYSMDMAELSGLSGQGNPFNPDSLKNITKTMADALRLVIADVDPKWFKETESSSLKDGSKISVHRLDITDKNRQEVETAVKGKIPELAELMKNAGIMNSEQAEAFKKSGSSFTLQAPGSISVKIDEAVMTILEQSLDLTYGSGDASNTSSIKLQQAYSDINGTPVFKKEIPSNARPLGDILKLLMPSVPKK